MRNLTIRRDKAYTGFLAKVQVYIEDPASTSMTISDTPCTKLGDIKNGETKTFVIDDASRKVFVIADKLSKNYCNDYYQIPEGYEDVFLSGRFRYNPVNGNAFRFDGVSDQAVLEHRKKGERKGLVIFLVCVVIGVIIGILSSTVFDTPQPTDFSNAGVTVTLTDDFIKVDQEGYDACYGSEDVAVFVIKESFTDAEGFGDLTLDEYGETVIEANEIEGGAELQKQNGVTYFEYEATNDDNETYVYFTTVHKGSDSFYIVQFAVINTKYAEYQPSFLEWAASIEVE